jgi:hypothetical protein
MRALLDLGHHPADIFAIFNDRIAGFEILQGDLVSERNVLESFYLEIGFAVEGRASGDLPRADIHDRHTYIVLSVMYEKVSHEFAQ